MLKSGRVVAACFAAGALLRAVPAFAQEDAAAEALFNKGLSEMEAGHYDTACPMIKESQRLDPRLGTLFTLAECEAKGGMIASALAHYEEYLRLFARLSPPQKSTQAGREKISMAQKTALAPQVPYVTLVLRAAPAGTTVKWDDLVFNLPALGVPLPVNPGEHVVTTQAPGGNSLVTRVTVEKGEHKRIELKMPPRKAKEPARAASAATIAPSASPASEPEPEHSETMSADTRSAIVYTAGAAGAVGLLVGSVSGAFVMGKKGTIDDNCVGTRCNATGKDAAETARTLGLVSTVGFGVGIAGLATAAFLLATEPKSAPPAARRLTPLIAEQKGGVLIGFERTW
jgi:hypothetical protein